MVMYGVTMASHHTKDKGDLGVLKAQIDLFEQGFERITEGKDAQEWSEKERKVRR